MAPAPAACQLSAEYVFRFEAEYLLASSDSNICLYALIRFVPRRIHLYGPIHIRIELGENGRPTGRALAQALRIIFRLETPI